MILQPHTQSDASEAAQATDRTANTPGGHRSIGADNLAVQEAASTINDLLAPLPEWSRLAIIAVVFVVIATIAHRVLFTVLGRVTRSDGRAATGQLVDHTRRPAFALFMIVAVSTALGVGGTLGLTGTWNGAGLSSTLAALFALAVTWLAIGFVRGADDMILARHRTDVKNNLKARRMHTQVAVISKTITVVLAIFGIGVALVQFEQVERIGTSLLASAGIAGIAIGFAARPVLGNIIAGIQIALTQPIRLDDVVIIDGEWGRIEEITTTYVVVKIWDERRLIVPFSKIIEEPFENWTRRNSQILGTVFFHADYTLPVDDVRQELKRLCEANGKWDGRVCVLQVTDATDRTLHIRALVSAEDAPTAWDLRCEIREQLIDYLRREHEHCLPRTREIEYRVDERTSDDS